MAKHPQLTIPAALPQRPNDANLYGKHTAIMLNTFNVVKASNTIVHQYDVAFTGVSKDYTIWSDICTTRLGCMSVLFAFGWRHR